MIEASKDAPLHKKLEGEGEAKEYPLIEFVTLNILLVKLISSLHLGTRAEKKCLIAHHDIVFVLAIGSLNTVTNTSCTC
jgi:hypothetical protein